MRNKIIAAIAAGGLLVAAGFVTAVISAPSTAVAQESTETGHPGFFERGLDFLSGVLDDLVGAGEIDQSDADTVLQAVEDKAEEIRAEREALRDQIAGFLEDGVLTEAEAAQLPDDHPFNSEVFDEAWSDGQLTTEEIREAMPHPRRDWFKRGVRMGAYLDDGGIDRAEWDEIVSNLPDDHPLTTVDVSSYLEGDGLITIDELREIVDDAGLHPFRPWLGDDTSLSSNSA